MTLEKNKMNLTEKQKKAREMICLPLDGLPTIRKVRERVRELSPVVGLFKIGKETYTRFGDKALEEVQGYGGDVFLDLKYHDIPNTVRGAADAATQLGVSMFNVHASGGYEMMKAAAEGAHEASIKYGVPKPKITGVTVLTSLDNLRYIQNSIPVIKSLSSGEEKESLAIALGSFHYDKAIDAQIAIAKEKDKGIKVKLQKTYQTKFGNMFDELVRGLGLENIIPDSVLNFAQMADSAGLDGIVCSAADLYAVKPEMQEDFMFVTPGIKGPNTQAGADQKRVFTPGNAVEDGSNILVVGRAITDPRTLEEKARGVKVTPEMRLQAGYKIIDDMTKHL